MHWWKFLEFSTPTHIVRFYWARSIPQRLAVPAAHFGYVFNMLSTFLCILQHYRMCQSAAVILCCFQSLAFIYIYIYLYIHLCMCNAFTLTVNAVRQVTNVHINGCVKNVAES